MEAVRKKAQMEERTVAQVLRRALREGLKVKK
jgi:hypothetical protein